jgi:hypothetical protein
MDKEQLVNNIKEWIKIDNELRELQKASKERRERKKELTNNLVDIMRENEIDCFDVNDGKIVYTKNKVKQTLNKKYLLSTLQNFYNDDPIQAKQLTEFILNNREEIVKENIRRKIT